MASAAGLVDLGADIIGIPDPIGVVGGVLDPDGFSGNVFSYDIIWTFGSMRPIVNERHVLQLRIIKRA
jgi:hypothetical protein